MLPPITELRVLYKVLIEPTCTAYGWLSWCLAKGLPFQILMQNSMAQSAVLQTSIPSLAPPSYFSDDGNICQSYISSVRALLRSPHPRRFLAEGGLIWRLAIAYGPPDLYSSGVPDPSTPATLHEISLENWANIQPANHEIDVMIGKMPKSNSTFWPPGDIFNNSHFFHGEWTPENEVWFVEWFDAIAEGASQSEGNFKPKSTRQWNTQFRRKGGASNVSPELLVGTPSHADHLLAELAGAYPDVVKSMSETRL